MNENIKFNKSFIGDAPNIEAPLDPEHSNYNERVEALLTRILEKDIPEKGLEPIVKRFYAVRNLHESVDSIIENNQLSIDKKNEFKKSFEEALYLALEIHGDQKPRPDGPYIDHILRVSSRLINEYGIKDIELVIAALLHDSVEDQAKKLALLVENSDSISEREKALFFVKNKFGERVAKIVSKLSNPEPETEGMSAIEKNNIYKEHVKEAIEDSDVFPIKLSDFSDNALNLEAVNDPSRRLKLSKKYLPVMEVFIERLKSAQNILSKEKITSMTNRLMSVIENTKTFINEQENSLNINSKEGVKIPKIGEKIYVPASYSFSSPKDDVNGGLATIKTIESNGDNYLITVDEHPGKKNKYGWKNLLSKQDQYAKEYKNQIAKANPDTTVYSDDEWKKSPHEDDDGWE